MMPSSRNVHPDWGWFAPPPNYRAILAAVSVATAIGATGSAAVVLSLVDYQAGVSDTQSISAPAKAPISLTKAEPIIAPPGESITLTKAEPIVAPPAEGAQAPSILSKSPLGPSANFVTPNEKEHQAALPVARNAGIHNRVAIPQPQHQFRRDRRLSALFQFPHSW